MSINLKLEKFLDGFDESNKEHIKEFCRDVSTLEVDIFIIMARKAACFFDCLQSLEAISLSGYVTSERILDLDTSWMKGLRVCILDDAIISGTTIYKTIIKLNDSGVSSIHIKVLSINEQYFSDKLFNDLQKNLSVKISPPYLKQSDAECIKQCKNIVNAISIFPRPYDVDFPYAQNFKLKSDEIECLGQLHGFRSFDVSSEYQKKNGVTALSLIPEKFVLHQLDERKIIERTDLINFKLRIYIRKSKGDSSSVVRLVPFVIFNPISEYNINHAFDQLVNPYEAKQEVITHCHTISSKFRLVQFSIANKFGEYFAEILSIQFGRKIDYQLNYRSLSFIFSKPLLDHIKGLASNGAGLRLIADNIALNPVMHPKGFSFKPSASQDIPSINHTILQPFIWLYKNWELPTREDVKARGLSALEDTKGDRLDLGFSLGSLLAQLSNVNSFRIDDYVSAYLDKMIDAGIIVPANTSRDGILYRGFRHGEDVVFSELEIAMCKAMLQSYMNSANKEKLGSYEVQKLLVLFFQIGVRTDPPYLSQYVSDETQADSCKVASVKYHLHGPIVINSDSENLWEEPYLESDRTREWMTNSLSTGDIPLLIHLKDQNKYQLNNKCETPELSKRDLTEAAKVGSLLGILVDNDQNGNRPSLNVSRDFLPITACITPKTIIGALSAEIYIFKENSNKILAQHVQDRLLNSRCGLKESKIITRKENIFFIALNSGKKKFKHFIDNDAIKIRDSVTKDLEISSSPFLLDTWLKMWPDIRSWNENSVREEEWSLINELGHWILSCLAYTSQINYLCLDKEIEDQSTNSSNQSKSFSDTNTDLEAEQEKAKKLIIDCFDMLLQHCPGVAESKHSIPYLREVTAAISNGSYKYRKGAIKALLEKINRLMYLSQELVDRASLMASDYGKDLNLRTYPYALIIRLTPKNEQNLEKLDYDLESFLASYYRNVHQKHSNEFSGVILPSDKNKLTNRLSVSKIALNTGNKNSAVTMKLAIDVHNHFSSQCSVKCSVLSDIPNECRVKYVGLTNRAIKAARFWEYVKACTQTAQQNDNQISIFERRKIGDHTELQKLPHDYVDKYERISEQEFTVGTHLTSVITVTTLNIQDPNMSSENNTGGISLAGITGSSVNIQVGDGNKAVVRNNSKVVVNDFEEVRRQLREHHVGDQEIIELENALSQDPKQTKANSFGEKTQKWMKKMISKSIDGSWSVGIATAGGVLANAVNSFYGL